MSFDLFGFDCYISERLFGFWLCGIKNDDMNRHLLAVYYSCGEAIVDVLWIRIITY